MTVFAVIALTAPANLKTSVLAQYGAGHFEISPSIWFVTDDGSTKQVADKLGVTNGIFGGQGVVLTVSAYSGYAPNSAWTWLQERGSAVPNG